VRGFAKFSKALSGQNTGTKYIYLLAPDRSPKETQANAMKINYRKENGNQRHSARESQNFCNIN